VAGLPHAHGRTPALKAAWLQRHADRLRTALVLEPRGHRDMTAACLTEPAHAGSHAGLVFMDAAGYPPLLGHGVIAAATIAIEHGLIVTTDGEPGERLLRFDTAAGTVEALVRLAPQGSARQVTSVRLAWPPAFVLEPGRAISVAGRDLRADLAVCGVCFAIVDSEAVGVPLDAARLPDLRRIGVEVCEAVNDQMVPAHPSITTGDGVHGAILIGAARADEAHLRHVTVSRDGAIDRSPGGAATPAVMAVLDAMGILPEGATFAFESLTGARFTGRVSSRATAGDLPAVLTEVEGDAWVTGRHTFTIDEADPFADGLSI
jgi:proline racemase